jgi:hypothetical protein
MAQSTLIARNGYLFIRHEDPMQNEPVMLITYYPTDLQASSYNAHLVGLAVRPMGRGRYQIIQTLREFTLPQGGDTLNIAEMTEKIAIKPPRKSKNYGWKWRYGKWEKDYSH